MRYATDVAPTKCNDAAMRLVCALSLCACTSPEAPGTDARFCSATIPGDVLSVEEKWPKTSDITVDAEYLYWVNFDGRAVRRIRKSGGIAETIATPNAPLSLAVDASTVYLLDGTGALDVAPIGGGGVSRLATATCAHYDYPCGWGIAVDDQTVYWGTGDKLRQQPKTSGPVTEINSTGYHFDDAVALDDDSVYVTRMFLGFDGMIHATLERIPKLGGPSLTLIDLAGNTMIRAFALDADHAYVSQTVGGAADSGRIWRVRKDGTELVDLGVPGSTAIAVDGGYVYIDRTTSIERITTSGGMAQTVACDPMMNVGGMAIDSDRIYWIDGRGPGIRSIVKPP